MLPVGAAAGGWRGIKAMPLDLVTG